MGRLACLGNEQANSNYSMGLGPVRPGSRYVYVSSVKVEDASSLQSLRTSGSLHRTWHGALRLRRPCVLDSDTQKR
jgi:hypothetical protein